MSVSPLLWEAISRPELPAKLVFTAWWTWHNIASDAEALLFGQPNFFTPRPVNPFLVPRAAPQEVSFYDTALAWADTNTPFLPIIVVVESGLMVVIGTSSQPMNYVELITGFHCRSCWGCGTQLARIE